MFERRVTVRFNDCDGLGHVNHAIYFTYMEEGRRDIFEIFNRGVDIRRWNLILASARCDYLAQVRYGEVLTVYTWIGRMGRTSFSTEHAIRREDGSWAARGRGIVLRFDYEENRPVPLDDALRARLEAHRTPPVGAPELRD
ncbi:MAG: acyl-CoA thioesterase [Thermoflavifilum sp.]|nr:acyl-CoA thioesterase [Thermoflavifilum sp.]MCL6514417.1 acyl-CoA thioesterase [Alicyclobacillus sp.]